MTVGSEPRSSVCTRSREWASLRLDGELSMLERRMLDGHLDRCTECRAFSEHVAAASGLMRDSALEAPTHSVDVSVFRRSRRVHATRTTLRSAAAAAAVACAVGAGVALPVGEGDQISPGLLVVVADDVENANEGEILRQERAAVPPQADEVARGFREVL
jgi:predicted anti-sigma-YlaC factor YlaD